jgi:HAE1 family hydrophobic/amphiphilic exporter-1
VRSQPDQRDLRQRLSSITVPNINMKSVPIPLISRTEERTGPATINRENRNRSVTIAADIAPNGPGMGGAITDIQEMTTKGELKLPAGISYSFSGQAENFRELGINMAIAMGLGILFIYLVLSSLYESFILPFTIMLVLPLALCGAFIALFVTHQSLDLFSMIGCVMLLGVATKNSILLVDYTLQLRQTGMPEREAIIKAGRTRLRPILMTSFALIAGMLPVAIGLNEASKQRTSMGIAIIGGLISSTFLTLVIIPAAYGYVERFNQWIKSFFRKQDGNDLDREIESVVNEVEKSPTHYNH